MGVSHLLLLALLHVSTITPSIAAILLRHDAVEIGLSTFRSNRTTRRMETTNCAETWLLSCQPTLRHIPEDGIYHQTAMRISHISTALTKRIQVM
jgi:hypothetical protein